MSLLIKLHGMPHLPSQLLSFSNLLRCITDNFWGELIQRHHDSPTEDIISTAWNSHHSSFPSVDWLAIQKPCPPQPWFSGTFYKIFHNEWDTTSCKHKWRITQNDTCPLCQFHSETQAHVLQCQNSTIHRVHQKGLSDIWRKFDTFRTTPEIISTFKTILSQRHSATKPSPPVQKSNPIQWFKSQYKIGMFNHFSLCQMNSLST